MAATKKGALIKIPTGDGPYVRAKHAQVISDQFIKSNGDAPTNVNKHIPRWGHGFLWEQS